MSGRYLILQKNGQYRSDFADVKTDQELHCPHVSDNLFLLNVAQVINMAAQSTSFSPIDETLHIDWVTLF